MGRFLEQLWSSVHLCVAALAAWSQVAAQAVVRASATAGRRTSCCCRCCFSCGALSFSVLDSFSSASVGLAARITDALSAGAFSSKLQLLSSSPTSRRRSNGGGGGDRRQHQPQVVRLASAPAASALASGQHGRCGRRRRPSPTALLRHPVLRYAARIHGRLQRVTKCHGFECLPQMGTCRQSMTST